MTNKYGVRDTGRAEAIAQERKALINTHTEDDNDSNRGVKMRGGVSGIGLNNRPSFAGFDFTGGDVNYENRWRMYSRVVGPLGSYATGHTLDAVVCEHRPWRADNCTKRDFDVL